jgi:serine O-acetyltransferase
MFQQRTAQLIICIIWPTVVVVMAFPTATFIGTTGTTTWSNYIHIPLYQYPIPYSKLIYRPRRRIVPLSSTHLFAATTIASSSDHLYPLPPPMNSTTQAECTVVPYLPMMLDVDDLWDAKLAAEENSNADSEDAIGIRTGTTTTTMTTATASRYRSALLSSTEQWETFIRTLQEQPTNTMCTTNLQNTYNNNNDGDDDDATQKDRQQQHHPNDAVDLFWEQIKHEAEVAVATEQQAGPQLYQGILSQPTLLSAICTVISHEIETELITAPTLKDLCMDLMTAADVYCIRQDLQAATSRDPSIETAMEAILFHKGFHAIVCYRVGHRLWQANRTGLAYYMQSIVSRTYSADIHPACTIGSGIYLRVGVGVVIGETAVVGNDVTICEGVTLGGTGKESGDRHPKVGNGVIVYNGGTILGNIQIGEGAIVSAKSIVTKPLPPLAIVSGVPATIQSYRNDVRDEEAVWNDDLQRHVMIKYLDRWRMISDERLSMK